MYTVYDTPRTLTNGAHNIKITLADASKYYIILTFFFFFLDADLTRKLIVRFENEGEGDRCATAPGPDIIWNPGPLLMIEF